MSTDPWKTLGEELRDLRLKQKVSIRDLVELGGDDLSRAAISRIELGERVPNAASLLAFARALSIEIVIGPDGPHARRVRRRKT